VLATGKVLRHLGRLLLIYRKTLRARGGIEDEDEDGMDSRYLLFSIFYLLLPLGCAAPERIPTYRPMP